MNVLSIFTLIEDALAAAAALWPKASQLQHANLVTSVVGASVSATAATVAVADGQVAPALDPSVVALNAALPAVVQSVIDLKNQLAATETTLQAAKAPVITTSTPAATTPVAPSAPVAPKQ